MHGRTNSGVDDESPTSLPGTPRPSINGVASAAQAAALAGACPTESGRPLDAGRSYATRLLGTRLRQQIAEADRKIKVQIQALGDGIEPELVTARIAELRDDKQAATAALEEIDPTNQEMEADELHDLLTRIPDLTQALREAPPQVKRQTFEAFGLRIEFDKAQRRIEVSATVSEAVAQAFKNTKALHEEGLSVTVSDIAGAGFEPATFGL